IKRLDAVLVEDQDLLEISSKSLEKFESAFKESPGWDLRPYTIVVCGVGQVVQTKTTKIQFKFEIGEKEEWKFSEQFMFPTHCDVFPSGENDVSWIKSMSLLNMQIDNKPQKVVQVPSERIATAVTFSKDVYTNRHNVGGLFEEPKYEETHLDLGTRTIVVDFTSFDSNIGIKKKISGTIDFEFTIKLKLGGASLDADVMDGFSGKKLTGSFVCIPCKEITVDGSMKYLAKKDVEHSVIHEIGHKLGLVPGPPPKIFEMEDLSGLDPSPNFYWEEKGHHGGHCWHGLIKGEKNFSSLSGKELDGVDCVMYGMKVSGKDDLGFCPVCTDLARKLNLSEGWGFPWL
ncbi:MAG: hypothetical protein ABIQ57_09515, partial [Candidatus Kapaibacterium sp.]